MEMTDFVMSPWLPQTFRCWANMFNDNPTLIEKGFVPRKLMSAAFRLTTRDTARLWHFYLHPSGAYGGWERTCKQIFFLFSRLFTSVFPTFCSSFNGSSFKTEVKSRGNGSEKSGKTEMKSRENQQKTKISFFHFPDFSLPFSRLFTSGSKKSEKRK